MASELPLDKPTDVQTLCEAKGSGAGTKDPTLSQTSRCSTTMVSFRRWKSSKGKNKSEPGSPAALVEMKRAILNEVLCRRPNKPLYHYTGQTGLLGIIGEKQIWATHTPYLNDRREFMHAVDLVREEISELLTSSDHQTRTILQEMKDGISGIESMNVCVCSFSEERDSLSQWRAYGSGTSGFAIGFPPDFLSEATEKAGWYLAPCIYDPSDQRTLIRSLVEEVLEQNIQRKRAAKTED